MNKIIDFESIENKLHTVANLEEWNILDKTFAEKKNIFLFGHGGNLAVCDHGAIDISRLTDKTAVAPGSGIVATSLISDCKFENWLTEWLKIMFRGIDIHNSVVIGASCSVGTESSNAIINALNFAVDQGIPTFLITAREKKEVVNSNITTIITHSHNYHTHEVLTLMLFYQLIYNYTNGKCPPSIKVVGQNPKNHDEMTITNAHVPPGFESDLKNLAIDFDGVIHKFDKGFHDGTCYGEPISGTLEAIPKLSKQYNLIVFSSKVRPDRPLINGKTGRELVIEWLKKYNLYQYVKDVTHEKPRAQYYIDDKAIQFNSNWTEICNKLLTTQARESPRL